MIGLLLIYFIGKAFYELAFDYNKSKWGFAILGVLSYYAGTFLGGVVLAIIGIVTNSDFPQNQPGLLLSIMAVPFGLLACWGFYKILVSVWNRKEILKTDDTLDGSLME